MKRKVFRNVVIALLVLEIPMLYLTFKSYANRDKDINKVSYSEQENIKTKSTLAYYLDGEPQENRNTWPTDSSDIGFLKAECYDGDGKELNTSDVITFNNSSFEITVNTATTVYCALYFVHRMTLDEIIANSHSLESEDDLKVRNETITGNVKDDLRRFVGDKDTVTDNFICFGAKNQQECKDNMDIYMYRIIGIDTEGRLKLIKATKLVQGSSTSTFQWHNSAGSNTTWPDADLYKRLNGNTTNTSTYPNIFIKNGKYSYMKEEKWTTWI